MSLESSMDFGDGLNNNGPYRLTYLNAQPLGNGRIRRCGLVEGNVWLGGALRFQKPTPGPVHSLPRLWVRM